MKKVIFLKQGLENFCNHIDPIEIDFTTGSITMITGPNGIGKTSIFQAIPYTLYGQCEKGRGEDVLNDKTGKNCHTWTIFTVDGIEYRVDRYVKYTRIGNLVSITRGTDSEPYLKGHKEVLPEIEKLLMPYKLFINTLLFSQKVKSFFTDLGDSDQKEIFRKILNLDNFVLYLQQCNTKLKSIEDIVFKLNQSIEVNKGLLESAESRLKDNFELEITFNQIEKERKDNLKIQIDNHKERIITHLENQKNLPQDTTTMQQIKSTHLGILKNDLSKIDDLNDKNIETLTNQAKLKISEMEKKSLEMSNLESNKLRQNIQTAKDEYDLKFKKAEEQINLIKNAMGNLDIKATKLNSELDFLEQGIDDLELGSITVCPTCLRDIDAKCIEHLGDLVQEKINKSGILRSEATKISEEYEDYQVKLTSWNEINKKDYNKCNETINTLQKANRLSITQFIERKNIAINKIEEMIKTGSDNIIKEKNETVKDINQEISELESEMVGLIENQKVIEQYNQTLTDIQSLLDGYTKNLVEAEKLKFDKTAIVSCSHEIEKYKKVIKECLSKRVEHDKKIDIIKFWKTGFSSSGIQSMLIDEAIPFMNNRIAYYMNLLCNGRYQVTFDTLKATKGQKEFRDKISVEVFDTETHSDKRVKFSGGQTRLVDIGTILTLSDLMANVQDVSFNIILFDEIFDSLDAGNIRYAANLLRMVSKDKWLGIISHTKIDDIEADNILEFR